jgi:hypothetical protein
MMGRVFHCNLLVGFDSSVGHNGDMFFIVVTRGPLLKVTVWPGTVVYESGRCVRFKVHVTDLNGVLGMLVASLLTSPSRYQGDDPLFPNACLQKQPLALNRGILDQDLVIREGLKFASTGAAACRRWA